jgi:hypothetical protein
MSNAIEMEIEQNFDFFQRNLSGFIERHRGKFALLRNRSVINFHESIRSAEVEGSSQFPDGVFSIQEVSDEPVDLGFFTHAFDTREA